LQKRFFLKEKKPKFAAFNVLMWIFFLMPFKMMAKRL